ncbi:hypothetical protein C477_13860 [Haloterrigena salina JCM 13891]|uniref:Uncharacterized protein n=1 Tax=Haloterrigena salina JCM 13891 TaxID=1227488 RepID=M0C211_9EURY|nr:hypothetical protein [Haloterrigena salina]ELZ17321.1 hypothetical protein C477_13860 [Haloterrigena salina JCM 13891]
MEFDLPTTAAAFIAVIAIGVVGLIAAPMMTTNTVLMMVAPSMIVFGLITLGIGIKYGEYRATGR